MGKVSKEEGNKGVYYKKNLSKSKRRDR